MTTLVHEDIYVYIDQLVEEKKFETGSDISFINNSIDAIADFGVFNITITSESFTSFSINVGTQSIVFNTPIQANDTLELDFREKIFKKNGSLIFPDNLFDLPNDSYTTINLVFSGTGIAEVEYIYNLYEETFEDVMFVESISVDESIERLKKTNVFNQEKTAKGEKKTYSFSINCLWNQVEEDRFVGPFRMRLVDEEGTELESLLNCRINSKGKSSSTGGDYTIDISGECEEVI